MRIVHSIVHRQISLRAIAYIFILIAKLAELLAYRKFVACDYPCTYLNIFQRNELLPNYLFTFCWNSKFFLPAYDMIDMIDMIHMTN